MANISRFLGAEWAATETAISDSFYLDDFLLNKDKKCNEMQRYPLVARTKSLICLWTFHSINHTTFVSFSQVRLLISASNYFTQRKLQNSIFSFAIFLLTIFKNYKKNSLFLCLEAAQAKL